MASKTVAADNSANGSIPFAAIFAAWLIPGGGHLWLRRWGRGGLLLLSIGALFSVGLALRGRLFELTLSNFVETLGFLGDFCAGLLFLAAKFFGYAPADLASPAADYGTKFLLVAGLLNVLCILDAYDIATGKKN